MSVSCSGRACALAASIIGSLVLAAPLAGGEMQTRELAANLIALNGRLKILESEVLDELVDLLAHVLGYTRLEADLLPSGATRGLFDLAGVQRL